MIDLKLLSKVKTHDRLRQGVSYGEHFAHNIDNAYAGGVGDGEIQLCRELLGKFQNGLYLIVGTIVFRDEPVKYADVESIKAIIKVPDVDEGGRLAEQLMEYGAGYDSYVIYGHYEHPIKILDDEGFLQEMRTQIT